MSVRKRFLIFAALVTCLIGVNARSTELDEESDESTEVNDNGHSVVYSSTTINGANVFQSGNGQGFSVISSQTHGSDGIKKFIKISNPAILISDSVCTSNFT